MRFTKIALDRLQPRPAKRDVSETGVSPDRRGLVLRIEPSGTKRFMYRFTLDGKTRRITLGTYGTDPGEIDLNEAHRRQEHARQFVLRGERPPAFAAPITAKKTRTARKRAKDRPPSLFRLTEAGERPAPPKDRHSVTFLAWEYFWRFCWVKRKRPEYVAEILDRDVVPRLGEFDARTITPRQIVEFLDEIVDRGAPVQANRTASVLGQMFRFGIGRGLVETQPVQLLLPPGGEEKSRDRVLSDDELAIVWSKLPEMKASPPVRHAIKVLALTGVRREDIAHARWENVDLEAALWTIPGAGHKKRMHDRKVPLPDLAVAEFKALKDLAGEDDHVMPAPGGGGAIDPKAITRAVSRSKKIFDLPHWTPHDLRRTVRTGLGRLGVDPLTAERAIGHAVGNRIERTYDRHDYTDEIRTALDQWAQHVAATVKPVRRRSA